MCLSGFSKKAVSTLKSVVDRYPSELSVWNDLGVKCLLAGQQEEARKAFTEVGIHFNFNVVFISTHSVIICCNLCQVLALGKLFILVCLCLMHLSPTDIF